MTDYAAILHAGISDGDYHGARNVLSSTAARKLLACPARFKWERDNPTAPKRAFDLGKVAHRLVLGEGATIAVVDAPDWRSKDAQQQRNAAYAERLTPILAADYADSVAMRDAVYAHPVARGLFREGQAELSGFFTDEPTTPTALRFRPDWMTDVDGRAVCVDFKTTMSADPAEFPRSVAKFGYHLQAAWYLAGLSAHDIDARFLFVAVEKTAPYPVSVIELDDEAIAEGHRLMRRAIDIFVRCTAEDDWPAYGDEVHTLSLPMWALPEMEITI